MRPRVNPLVIKVSRREQALASIKSMRINDIQNDAMADVNSHYILASADALKSVFRICVSGFRPIVRAVIFVVFTLNVLLLIKMINVLIN